MRVHCGGSFGAIGDGYGGIARRAGISSVYQRPPALPDSMGIFLSKLLTPLAYGFVADIYSLAARNSSMSGPHTAIAESESEIQPNRMTDNFGWIAITRVHFFHAWIMTNIWK